MARRLWLNLCGLILLMCLGQAAPALASAMEEMLWEIRINGSHSTIASASSAPDGGLYLAGHKSDAEDESGPALGGQDGWIFCLSPEGKIIWQKRLGGSGDDAFTHILTTQDGGCLVLGTTASADGDVRNQRGALDAWVIKLSPDGELIWQKTLGGTRDDALLSVALGDGIFVLAGKSQSYNGDLTNNHGEYDAWACAISAEDGKSIWHQRFGEGGEDTFTCISPGNKDFLLIGDLSEPAEGGTWQKRPNAALITPEGEVKWQTALGNVGDELHGIQATSNGWLLGGMAASTSEDGGRDAWFLLLRDDGRTTLQKLLGGDGVDTIKAMLPLANGMTVALGTTNSNDGQIPGVHGGQDIWVAQITTTGQMIWQQALGGSAREEATDILRTADGYLIAGTTFSQDGDIGMRGAGTAVWLAHILPNGNLDASRLVFADQNGTLDLVVRDAKGTAYLIGHALTEGGKEVCIARVIIE